MKSLVTVLVVLVIGAVIFIFWTMNGVKTGFNVTLPSQRDVPTQATPSSLRFKTPFDKHETGSKGNVMTESAKYFQQKKGE